MKAIYLHLGCGDRKFDGFINIDALPGADMQLDLTGPLPWEQGTVTGIYSEHFIEHITQAQAIRLLHECRRILKPGGVVRIATPDLAQIVADYSNRHTHSDYLRYGMDWIDNPAEQLNMAVRWWGHQWMYDEEELSRIGRMVGLDVKGRYKLGESPDPMLRNREHREYSGLIIEFTKPDRRIKPGEKPLVTIAIPSYNPTFFRLALESALAQTYTHLEILICDDCASDGIEKITLDYQSRDARIRYLRNPPEIARKNFGRDNYVHCYNLSRGEFIKFLNDDDLLAPNCVERMMQCFAIADDITLVTSKRQIIDEEGQHQSEVYSTTAPVSQDSIIEGLSLGSLVLANGKNVIGEPTTVLFRKADLADIYPDPLSMDRKKLVGVCDLAMWLNLITKGNAIYLMEPLSYFRRHGAQVQEIHRPAIGALAQEGWSVLKKSWSRRGLMTPK
jgi:predicted SAM-dependent methyltransferase/glycosyltransferase involved in cell wall biosynthesis